MERKLPIRARPGAVRVCRRREEIQAAAETNHLCKGEDRGRKDLRRSQETDREELARRGEPSARPARKGRNPRSGHRRTGDVEAGAAIGGGDLAGGGGGGHGAPERGLVRAGTGAGRRRVGKERRSDWKDGGEEEAGS